MISLLVDGICSQMSFVYQLTLFTVDLQQCQDMFLRKTSTVKCATRKLIDRSSQCKHHIRHHPELVDSTMKRKLTENCKPVKPRQSRRHVSLASVTKSELTIRERICNGLDVGLKVREIEGKGRGVISRRTFNKGEFICDYPGDLISAFEVGT